jgi:hypothetical protein
MDAILDEHVSLTIGLGVSSSDCKGFELSEPTAAAMVGTVQG